MLAGTTTRPARSAPTWATRAATDEGSTTPADLPVGGRHPGVGRPPAGWPRRTPRPSTTASRRSGRRDRRFPGPTEELPATAARPARPATASDHARSRVPDDTSAAGARSDPAVDDHASDAGSSSPSLGCRPDSGRARLRIPGVNSATPGEPDATGLAWRTGGSADRRTNRPGREDGHATGGQDRGPTRPSTGGWPTVGSELTTRPGAAYRFSTWSGPLRTDRAAAPHDGSPWSPTPTGTASGTTRSRPSGCKLVRLVDGLLDQMERDSSYTHFLLDGQLAVIDDYLEIRPENRDRLRGTWPRPAASPSGPGTS